jgi:hypothetical protein
MGAVVLEAQAVHRLADMARGQGNEGRRGIEGGHTLAKADKGQRIAAGVAARTENMRPPRQQRQKAGVEQGHVYIDRLGEEGLRVVLVVSMLTTGPLDAALTTSSPPPRL